MEVALYNCEVPPNRQGPCRARVCNRFLSWNLPLWQALAAVLQRAGWRVTTAQTTREALQALTHKRYEVLVVDLESVWTRAGACCAASTAGPRSPLSRGSVLRVAGLRVAGAPKSKR
jgi:hypothetical protein